MLPDSSCVRYLVKFADFHQLTAMTLPKRFGHPTDRFVACVDVDSNKRLSIAGTDWTEHRHGAPSGKADVRGLLVVALVR